jgi:hypothetical protein
VIKEIRGPAHQVRSRRCLHWVIQLDGGTLALPRESARQHRELCLRIRSAEIAVDARVDAEGDGSKGVVNVETDGVVDENEVVDVMVLKDNAVVDDVPDEPDLVDEVDEVLVDVFPGSGGSSAVAGFHTEGPGTAKVRPLSTYTL